MSFYLSRYTSLSVWLVDGFASLHVEKGHVNICYRGFAGQTSTLFFFGIPTFSTNHSDVPPRVPDRNTEDLFELSVFPLTPCLLPHIYAVTPSGSLFTLHIPSMPQQFRILEPSVDTIPKACQGSYSTSVYPIFVYDRWCGIVLLAPILSSWVYGLLIGTVILYCRLGQGMFITE